MRHFGPTAEPRPELFVPIAQAPASFWRFVARTFYIVAQPRSEPAGALTAIRRTLSSVDSTLPLYRGTTLQQFHRDAAALPRVYGTCSAVSPAPLCCSPRSASTA